MRASEKAPGSVIEALIEAGASVSISDDPKTSVDSTYGYTPLHAAAFNGNLSAASALLKFGADVRMREEKYHGTPAGWAQYAGHMAVRDRILLEPVDLMEALEYQLSDRVQTILQDDGEALNRPFLEYPLYPLYAEGWHTPLAFAGNSGLRRYGPVVACSRSRPDDTQPGRKVTPRDCGVTGSPGVLRSYSSLSIDNGQADLGVNALRKPKRGIR